MIMAKEERESANDCTQARGAAAKEGADISELLLQSPEALRALGRALAPPPFGGRGKVTGKTTCDRRPWNGMHSRASSTSPTPTPCTPVKEDFSTVIHTGMNRAQEADRSPAYLVTQGLPQVAGGTAGILRYMLLYMPRYMVYMPRIFHLKRGADWRWRGN